MAAQGAETIVVGRGTSTELELAGVAQIVQVMRCRLRLVMHTTEMINSIILTAHTPFDSIRLSTVETSRASLLNLRVVRVQARCILF